MPCYLLRQYCCSCSRCSLILRLLMYGNGTYGYFDTYVMCLLLYLMNLDVDVFL
ncbi:hypothetical protein MKX03_036792 [Papaver bracteatum]|nr:hypothetical protein MKX03_036792 [Papaver bracteatum]